jgi:hypothetical protein
MMSRSHPTHDELAARIAALEQAPAAVADVLRIIHEAPTDLSYVRQTGAWPGRPWR